jgi:hypothetical protein
MIHGAELRVHFLKSFQKGSTCENLSQKGLKSKKKTVAMAWLLRLTCLKKDRFVIVDLLAFPE